LARFASIENCWKEMDQLPLYLTPLVLGFVHALEPDHMAAVTTFVSRRPRLRDAMGFGLRWGLGHSGAILLVGMGLILGGVRIPPSVATGMEFGVGTLLLALGLWLLWGVVHGGAHALARHAEDGHSHDRGSLWVGVAHGLSGTAALLTLLPVTLIRSSWAAGGYLFLFGVGTTLAMALYAGVAGMVFQQAGRRSPAVGGTLRAATALGSAALGIFWMVNAMVA
jgi:nickel/cobalt transporter (NicO) family protein